jgi:hypothetical protein
MSPLAPALHHEDTGAWLWHNLREAFPDAVAVTLMPDHPHLVVPDAPLVDQRLARLLGHFGRTFRVRGRAAAVASPEPIRSRAALARHVRYVALNPCRANLVRCPLAWPWSTHRDVVGACADPWVTAERLARVLGVSRRSFEARHHAYVSADPHADVAGTPMPHAAKHVDVAALPLQFLIDAVAAATRSSPHAITRKGLPRALFVALAIDQGWRQPALLSRVARCSPRTIHRLAQGIDADVLDAARLCAASSRLRTLAPRGENRDVRTG